MADDEAEQGRSPDNSVGGSIRELRRRLDELQGMVAGAGGAPDSHTSADFCQRFCTTLLEYAGRWRVEEEPLPLVEVYIVALSSYGQASPYLSPQCEHVPLLADRLSLSFAELLISLKEDIPKELWRDFQHCVQFAHSKLQENGITQLSLLSVLGQYDGVWSSSVLQGLLSNAPPQPGQVEEFLVREGLVLLEMRVKQLMKDKELAKAALLAKTCSESRGLQETASFKQMYLVCLCATSEKSQLMEELAKEDCREALEMICNLESDGDESAAFSLCTAFLTRQLLQGDAYCAWELTLFWSKLLKRLEPSEQAFLERCRQMSLVSKTVFHILFLIKVIQSEVESAGLPVCIEMCIRALRMESNDGGTRATVCKTISCLLPTDLEVKRACQLTEFLLEPTVDSYYAVETLFNEPDQKLEEENMPVPNSLRCELLLVFKTQWPFDPEFWDWKTLKRHCLALMGEEASIVSSIDLLNDAEDPEEEEDFLGRGGITDFLDHSAAGTYELKDITDRKQKNREMKKLREKGFISARFRNWQAYMQYCVLCDKEFLGHRIVRHAQTHFGDGVYSCPICAQTFTSKDTLIPHVTLHVKESCKERLTAMKTNKKLANPKMSDNVIAALNSRTEDKHGVCHGENGELLGSAFHSAAEEAAMRLDADGGDSNVCPVGNCKRSFKYFKNLIAHIKSHGDNDEAKTFLEMQKKKVVCQYCRRHFINVTHLNDHLQVHCGVRPYICIQVNCKASFLSNTELLMHRKTHPVFKAKCMFPNCGKIFNEAFKLYDHEAQHYKTFTCKVSDCGKIFHTQQQLDLHMERHVAPEEAPSPGEAAKRPQPGPSLIRQMLSNHTPIKQENYQDNLNTEIPMIEDHTGTPVESFLQSSQAPPETSEQCSTKYEQDNLPLFNRQTQSSDQSMIQPMAFHVSDVNGCTDGSGGHSFSYMEPPHQSQMTTAPFESAGGNLFHSCNAEMLQGQPPMFPSAADGSSTSFTSDCHLASPGRLGPARGSNMSAVAPLQNAVEPAMSQPLPPTATPQPLAGKRAENPVSSSGSTGQRERYHCAFETCPRHYSSYRNVTKHMKAVHPEFYEQWKVAQTEIKISYVQVPVTAPMGNPSLGVPHPNLQRNRLAFPGVQRQNVIQSAPYSSIDASSSYSGQPSNSSSAHKQNPSLLVENVLSPVSQFGRESNSLSSQPQMAGHLNWHSLDGGDQNEKCKSSQICASNMQAFGPGDSSSAPLPASVPSYAVNNPTQSLRSGLMESGSHSVLPSYIDSAQEGLQHADNTRLYASHMQSGSVPSLNSTGKAMSMQNHAQSNFPPEGNDCQNVPGTCDESPNGVKSAKRNKRTKWPAILKDGKFVCRRCFRQFDSPKSLGGHLSKRASCKPYEESALNSDLPTSFLDLLNSEQMVSTAQLPLSYCPTALYQESAHPSANSASVPANANYSQDNMSVYGKIESSDDILKQIMCESDMSDFFVESSTAQPLFQNPAVACGSSECLPANSVIQHTESLQPKREHGPCGTAHYPKQTMGTFAANEFSNPILSQILTDSCSSASTHISTTDIASEAFSYDYTRKTPDTESSPIKQMPDTRPNPSVSGGMPSEMQKSSTEQDIKKRLREQILAGDFQRRQGSCHSGSTETNVSKNPIRSVPVQSSKNSAHNQISHNVKTDSVTQGQEKPAASSEPFVKIELMRTENFTCFRESSPPAEILSPAETLANEADPEPSPLSACQQQWMAEVQCAFERLDLVREVSDQTSPSSANPNCGVSIQAAPAQASVRGPATSVLVKPFVCENENCRFSSMSSDSLWRHLSKTHSYTIEMINVVKKRFGQYAPFKCLKCSKTYTRNSNLRTHYLSAHKLSPNEIADLDMKRRHAKAVAVAALQNRPADKQPVAQVVVKQEYSAQALVPHAAVDGTQENVQDDNGSTLMSPTEPAALPCQASTQAVQAQIPASPLLSAQAGASDQWLHGQQTDMHKVFAQAQQCGVRLARVSVPLTRADCSPALLNGSQPPDKHDGSGQKKAKERKPKSDDAMSPYRPYRCVHQGCVAAFTIQHNLILHYRAVHQSALSALEVNKEQEQSDGAEETPDRDDEGTDVELPQVSEFRCQVKDCSRVFQEVSNLMQHYLLLHEFGLDKVCSLLSSIALGKFACGQQGCTAIFTACWKYICHLKEQHKELLQGNHDQLNGSFKCEIEGCDRSYATKSNLLRHAMKKHQELYEPKLKYQVIKDDATKQNAKTLHYQIAKTSNGKENIESNKKVLDRAKDTKKVGNAHNHWTKYGKPSLKSKVEASAMCTKKFPLQYPCMIKGCESVMKSEKNILKHYMGHGLSEKYLELQRSHFIFCKKVPRQKCHSIRSDDSKSDGASDLSDHELSGEARLDDEQGDNSKPVLRKRAPAGLPAALLDTKASNEESSDGTVVLKRKRGRPRKFIEKMVKPQKISRAAKSEAAGEADEQQQQQQQQQQPPAPPAAVPEEASQQSAPLSSFKPMGFEVSFLKFLEQSNQSQDPSRRNGEVACEWRPASALSTKDTCVRFINHHNLKSLSKVKLVIDKAFSGVTELMLKQLQDMWPTVVLERHA